MNRREFCKTIMVGLVAPGAIATAVSGACGSGACETGSDWFADAAYFAGPLADEQYEDDFIGLDQLMRRYKACQIEPVEIDGKSYFFFMR